MAESNHERILSPAQMAQAAGDSAYAEAINRPLASFLLGLTAGCYIGVGFVFYVTSQIGINDAHWGLTRVVGGLECSTGMDLVALAGAGMCLSDTLTHT